MSSQSVSDKLVLGGRASELFVLKACLSPLTKTPRLDGDRDLLLSECLRNRVLDGALAFGLTDLPLLACNLYLTNEMGLGRSGPQYSHCVIPEVEPLPCK